MPRDMNIYTQFKTDFVKTYGQIDRDKGMLKHATFQGEGRIGLAHPEGEMKITQDFVAREIIGDYSQMKAVYQQIMQDYPEAKDYYNLYLTDPSITPREENKTRILIQL